MSFVEGLYAARDLAGFQTYILAALPRIVPADHISYNEVNPKAKRYKSLGVPVPPSELWPAWERHMADHPLLVYYHRTGDGRALKVSDFLSQRQFHRLGLYNEFFRPIRVEHQIAITLPAPPFLVVGIALSRSRRDFSGRERRLLDLLRPHLIQAYQNAESITRMREEQAITRQALDGLSYGIIALTRDGRIRLTNARALRMLTTYWGEPPWQGDCLPEELAQWVGHRTADTHTLESPRAPLVVQREGCNLVVRLIGGGEEHLLLLEEQTIALSPHSLVPLGVTRREAEVLTWIVQGKTNAEIAAILGTSPYTVINHLRHIFDKFGVKTRTAAAAYVLRPIGISPMAHEINSPVASESARRARPPL